MNDSPKKMPELVERPISATGSKTRDLSGQKLQQFFEDALRPNDPRPSPDDCEKLAHDIRIIVNRMNNAELEQEAQRRGFPVDRSLLKDISLRDEKNKLVGEIQALAHQMLRAADELEELGGYAWTDFSLADVQQNVGRIAFSPDGAGYMPQRPRSSARGRPREPWHAPGRKISRLLAAAMRTVGYGGRLHAKDAESVTAIVGAAVISWIFKSEITPEGYATGMRRRDRSRRAPEKSFEERFPQVARLKISKQFNC